MDRDTKRVFLWTHPRALSTAFMRCIEGIPNSKVVFEPFMAAQMYGPGGSFLHLPGCNVDPEYSYQKVKYRLEQDYSDIDLIFVKDMAFSLEDEQYEMIPRGYQHTFLIRHPLKTFVSYFKCISDTSEGFAYREMGLPTGYFYGEIVDLYKYVVAKGDDPMIIDADDLLANPDLMMRTYCQRIGVNYSKSILTWDAANTDQWMTSKVMLEKISTLTWLENSVKPGGFNRNISKPVPSMDAISSDVKEGVEGAMPFYEELYKLRHRVTEN